MTEIAALKVALLARFETPSTGIFIARYYLDAIAGMQALVAEGLVEVVEDECDNYRICYRRTGRRYRTP